MVVVTRRMSALVARPRVSITSFLVRFSAGNEAGLPPHKYGRKNREKHERWTAKREKGRFREAREALVGACFALNRKI